MLKLTHNQSILTPLILLIALSFIYISFSTTSDTAFAAKAPKVEVCHLGHVISVSVNAVCVHLAHGDCYIGEDQHTKNPGRSCENHMDKGEMYKWLEEFGCK